MSISAWRFWRESFHVWNAKKHRRRNINLLEDSIPTEPEHLQFEGSTVLKYFKCTGWCFTGVRSQLVILLEELWNFFYFHVFSSSSRLSFVSSQISAWNIINNTLTWAWASLAFQPTRKPSTETVDALENHKQRSQKQVEIHSSRIVVRFWVSV